MIFLVGYMGSGKTTLAKKMAHRLGIPFIDLDQEIISSVGQSIPEYFEANGEQAFRLLESEVLRRLDVQNAAVIATGGGTPCFHNNMDWMNQHGKTIYLQISPKALWSRLSHSDISKRPVLQGFRGEELLDFITQKLAEREPFYMQARFVVDQLHDSVDTIIDKCRL